MTKIGLIPLRKNSKGIPGKNKKKLLGLPLFAWVLGAAIFSELDEVYMFTDDQEIIDFINKEYTWTKKVKALLRSEANAKDTSLTEDCMLEFCNLISYNFEVLCLLQATSPFTTSKDINAVLAQLKKHQKDSALTVIKTHRFAWNNNGTPQNYDPNNRPRRQDFSGLLIENGAVYATTKKAFEKSKNRLSGNIGLVEMNEHTYLEIDTHTDWIQAELLLTQQLKQHKKPTRITHLVLDVDGVFTDGSVYYDQNGEALKKFDIRDGMGLEILRQHNVEVVVMTSENSALVEARMKKLMIKNTFMGVKDKHNFLQNFLIKHLLSYNEVAYVGDDVNDLANLCHVGWSFCPANATQIVKNQVDFVLNNNSGQGAIREVSEWLIRYNQNFKF